MANRPRPPGPAVRLVSLVFRRDPVEADVLADLESGFAEKVEREGLRRATLWYWRQALGIATHQWWARVFDPEVAATRRRRMSGRRRGGVRVVRRDGGRWEMETMWRDCRYALRGFRRSPGFTLVAVLTIALGVGANTAIFSVVNGVLLLPLPYPDADRLVRVWPEKRWSGQMFEQVVERTTSFEGMSLYRTASYALLGDGEPEEVRGARVSWNHFDVIGVRPAIGRSFVREERFGEGGGAAILSDGLWRRRYGGDRGVIGRTVRISGLGRETRTIVGVLPPEFRPLNGGDSEVWTPVEMDPDSLEYAGQYGFSVVARLVRGRTVDAASAEVRSLVAELTPEHPTQFRQARYSPVDVDLLSRVTVRDVRTLLLTLLAAVGLVLLIACANVANLLLARTLQRGHELSLRRALGAERRHILRQLLAESTVLGLGGGLAGLFLAWLSVPLLEARMASTLPRAPTGLLDLPVLGFTVATAFAAGLLFGLAPALRAMRSKGVGALAQAGRGTVGDRSRNLLNGSLVASEVALAVLLVVGASLVLKSFWKLTRQDVGFPTEGLLAVTVALPEGRYASDADREAYFTSLRERLRAVPGVESSAVVSYLPLGGGSAGLPYRVEGQPLPEGTPSMVFDFHVVTPEYFRTMGIRLVEGRLLDSTDGGGTSGAVVSEEFRRRHWPNESAVGKRVLTSTGDPLFEIVGVVSDVKYDGLGEDLRPTAYLTPWQTSWNVGNVVVRGLAGASDVEDKVVAVLRDIDPEVVVVRVRTMDEMVTASLGGARSVTGLFSAFAALALLLGTVGVYGITSYSVSQRLREVGVRLALGASGGSVLRETIIRAMAPVGAGLAIGVALSLATTRVLSGLLFQVEPTDPGVIAAVAGLIALAGIAASFPPAWRAGRADPAAILKGA